MQPNFKVKIQKKNQNLRETWNTTKMSKRRIFNNLSIYLSIYLPTYLSIYLSIYRVISIFHHLQSTLTWKHQKKNTENNQEIHTAKEIGHQSFSHGKSSHHFWLKLSIPFGSTLRIESICFTIRRRQTVFWRTIIKENGEEWL